MLGPGCDGQRPAFGHGVACVERQVQERVLQLGRVDPRLALAGEHRLEPDRRPQRVPQQLARRSHHGVDVDQPGFEPLAAREGQETLGEVGTVLQDRSRLFRQLRDPPLTMRKLEDHVEIEDGQASKLLKS